MKKNNEVSQIVGYTVYMIAQYEADARKPLDEILVKLDKILGVLSLYDKIN